MVSAFIQKTGKAMALLPVLNLEIAEVTVLYAEGRVCVYFKMCSKLMGGSPETGVVCALVSNVQSVT